MIEDSKWVKSVEEKPGAKGPFWEVTWQDDKKDRLFDTAMVDTCQKALMNQLAVHFTKEKKGTFWNIVSLEFVQHEMPPPTKPGVLPEHQKVIDEAVESTATAVKSTVPDREKDIHRQVALKCAVELRTHGLIEGHHVLPAAERMRKYLDKELTEAQIYEKATESTKKEG